MTEDRSQRRDVLGVAFDAVSFEEALKRAIEFAQDASKTNVIVAVNPEKVMAARRSAELANFIRNSALAVPDGIGIVAAAKLLYRLNIERVPGADLALAFCKAASANNLKIFLFGAQEEVNRRAAAKLKEIDPNIQIVGRQNGYINEEQYDSLVERINESRANAVLIALGSPKQERWIAEYGSRLNAGLCMGVGGAFDALVGKVKRAPLAWQNAGLEWFYRLLRQPSRFRRQRRIFQFAFLVVCLTVKERYFTRVSRRDSRDGSHLKES